MDNGKYGTCDEMCPKEERQMKIKNNLLHKLETSARNGETVIIKSYARSAAGVEVKKEDVRTPQTLINTVHYLITEILNKKDEPYHVVYNFVFNRLRSVRQDLVIQGMDFPEVKPILEVCVRFHLVSSCRLTGEDIGVYDDHINNTHLQECLSRLLEFYKRIDDASQQRIEMEAIYILVNLGSSHAVQNALLLPINLRSKFPLNIAINLNLLWLQRNFVGFLKITKNLPFTLQCSLISHLPLIQKQAIKVMNAAYSFKNSRYPLSKLRDLLILESEGRAQELLRTYGISISDGHACFLKGSFQEDIKPTLEGSTVHFIRAKEAKFKITDIALGDSTLSPIQQPNSDASATKPQIDSKTKGRGRGRGRGIIKKL